MVNIGYIFRKKNTYIYMLLFLCSFLFIIFLSYRINNLETNYRDFEYYFLVDDINMNRLDKSEILIAEDCLLINNIAIMTINDSLNVKEIILPYSISEKDNLIKENNLKVVGYDNNGSISKDVFEELKEEYGYKRIYLNKISDYDKYDEISTNILISKPSNLQDVKGTISLFKTLFIFIIILLSILIIILIFNIMYDNKKYFKMLKLFGYQRLMRITIIIAQILLMLIIPTIITFVIYLFTRMVL